MNFSNVNIGTSAGDHTGDSLRVAFDKINRNFAEVNNNAGGGGTIAAVDSVNGQTGNVRLTVANIAGAVTPGQVSAIVQSNLDGYATVAYVDESIPDLTGVSTMISDAIAAENLPDLRAAQNFFQSQLGSLDSDVNVLQTNVATLTTGLATTSAAVTTANTRMKSYVDAQTSAITTAWTSNAASQASTLTTLSANAATQASHINSLNQSVIDLQAEITGSNAAIVTANTAMKSYVDAQTSAINTSWTANAVVQDSKITAANAAIVTANTAMKSYVDAQTSAINTSWTANAGAQATTLQTLVANAGTQSDAISALVANAVVQDSKITAANAAIDTKAPIASPTFTGNATAGNVFASGFFYANGMPFVSSSYSDANVASYLESYTGNITAGNVTVSGNLHYTNITYDNVTIDGNIIAKNYYYAGTGPVTITSNNDLNINAVGRVYVTSVEGLVSNANVTTSRYFIGDGSKLSNIFVSTTYNDSNVATYLATTNPVTIAHLSVTNPIEGELHGNVTGNVTATTVSTGTLTATGIVSGAQLITSGNITVGTPGVYNYHALRGNVRIGSGSYAANVSLISPLVVSIPNTTTTVANAVIHAIGRTQAGIVGDSFGVGASTSFTGRHARGTSAAPTAVVRGDRIAQFTALGYGETGYAQDNAYPGFNLYEAGMSIEADETFTDTSMASSVTLWVIPTGANTGVKGLSVTSAGNVLIPGTTSSNTVDTGALTVKGGVGISGNLHVTSNPGHIVQIDQGQLIANAAIDATSSANGAFIIPNGGMGVAGNVYVATQPNTRLQVGQGGAFFDNVISQFTGNVDSYLQVNMQNLNSGQYASSDLVATADVGTDSQYYVNVGINNSSFADPNYPAMAPLDSYLVADGGNLLVIAERVGKTITFMQGGYEVSNIVGTWGQTNLSVNTDLTVLGNIKYTPTNPSNWNGTITNIKQALDEIAQRLRTAGF